MKGKEGNQFRFRGFFVSFLVPQLRETQNNSTWGTGERVKGRCELRSKRTEAEGSIGLVLVGVLPGLA